MSSSSDEFQGLANVSVIVADTGDIESIRKFKPVDATTNPSLILDACQKKEYAHIIDAAIEYGAKFPEKRMEMTMDRLAVGFGAEISKIVPGVVSTEVDARLSFDTAKSIEKARLYIKLYEELGVSRDKILVKLATTWEGIKAAEVLEKEGIHVNMTLLFAMAQAIACSQVGATLISPFVGRILDWYVQTTGKKDYTPETDPGVKSVTDIYNYYKSVGSKTIVMGASFRSKGEVLALAGCDKLTIGPKFLEELKASSGDVKRRLSPDGVTVDKSKAITLTESEFRWQLNQDQMATEKLSEGIRKFAADSVKLEGILKQKMDEYDASKK